MRSGGVVVLEGGGGDLCCFLGVLRCLGCLGCLWLVSKRCLGVGCPLKGVFLFRFLCVILFQ